MENPLKDTAMLTSTKKLGNPFLFVVATEKINLVLQNLLYIALASCLFIQNTIFTTLVSVIIIVYFIFSKPYEHFFFFIGFVPFEHIARLGNISSYFIFLLISILKLIIESKKYKLGGILCLFCLCSIEFVRDFSSISNGDFLVILSTILYFYFFIQFSDKRAYDPARIVQNFCLSYVVVITQTIFGYGSVGNLPQLVATNSQIIRFGHEAISVGGAMGIPLYSALVISMLLSYYVERSEISLRSRMLILFMCIVGFIFGVLTISRSFLLCMVACLIFLILSISDRRRKRVFKILSLVVIIGIIAYFVMIDSVNSLISNFAYRASIDSGTGTRGAIWGSCFRYLNEHPFGYLWGFGIGNYIKIGFTYNLLFSAMAHNLYLDAIMSVGVIGIACFIYLLNLLKLKLKSMFHTKMRFITALPLLVFFVFGLTALSLNNFKTWIYIIMLVIFIYAIPIEADGLKGEVYDEMQ